MSGTTRARFAGQLDCLLRQCEDRRWLIHHGSIVLTRLRAASFWRLIFVAFIEGRESCGNETPAIGNASAGAERQALLTAGALFDQARKQWKVHCEIFQQMC